MKRIQILPSAKRNHSYLFEIRFATNDCCVTRHELTIEAPNLETALVDVYNEELKIQRPSQLMFSINLIAFHD